LGLLATFLVAHRFAISVTIGINMHKITDAPTGPTTDAERIYAAAMLDYMRRAGRDAAWLLLEKMNAAADDGATQGDHLRAVMAALAALPMVH
jgi:DNA-directed RNA polymerase specialized sigma24 family protein